MTYRDQQQALENRLDSLSTRIREEEEVAEGPKEEVRNLESELAQHKRTVWRFKGQLGVAGVVVICLAVVALLVPGAIPVSVAKLSMRGLSPLGHPQSNCVLWTEKPFVGACQIDLECSGVTRYRGLGSCEEGLVWGAGEAFLMVDTNVGFGSLSQDDDPLHLTFTPFYD